MCWGCCLIYAFVYLVIYIYYICRGGNGLRIGSFPSQGRRKGLREQSTQDNTIAIGTKPSSQRGNGHTAIFFLRVETPPDLHPAGVSGGAVCRKRSGPAFRDLGSAVINTCGPLSAPAREPSDGRLSNLSTYGIRDTSPPHLRATNLTGAPHSAIDRTSCRAALLRRWLYPNWLKVAQRQRLD